MTGRSNWTRRDFVWAGSAGLLLTTLPLRTALARPVRPGDPSRPTLDPADLHALAMRAIGAARDAGATYADIRLTRTETQRFFGTSLNPDQEELAVGVRALKDGYWGFSASPYWDSDEVVRLAHEAVDQAKSSALSTPRTVDLGQYPVASGSWMTPVQIDPFGIPIEEKVDFMRSWLEFADQYRAGVESDSGNAAMSFKRQLRVLATTEGAFCTQTVYETEGSFGIVVGPADWRDSGNARVQAKGLRLAGKGWEMFLNAKLRDQLPQLVETGDALRALPSRPVELGRFDIVFDGATMASLVDCTIGTASELDRASGYFANDGGTSYLAPPLSVIGTLHAAAPIVTITANRSAPTQLATVKWDDEGVEPDDFTLVKDGLLVDYQTTRESASWLASYYQEQKRPVRSHGCACADNAMSVTMLQTPNLALLPGKANTSLDEMIANVKHGMAVLDGNASTDFQATNGTGPGNGVVREIRNGKLGAVINNAEFTFTSQDFWQNVAALGGLKTVQAVPTQHTKGNAGQASYHTVSAPAATVANVAIIDRSRS